MRPLAILCLGSALVYASPAPVGNHSVGIRFEKNQGQGPKDAAFLARTATHTLFLTKQGIRFDRSFEARFAGSNPAAVLEGVEETPAKVNYLLGDLKIGAVATFQRIRYSRLYPGIDLVYYAHEGEIEYDFAVQPGSNPRQIGLAIKGSPRIKIDPKGDLILGEGANEMRWKAPVIYQDLSSGRQSVSGGYEIQPGNFVRFRLEDYDHTRALIIDPILMYATYLGGAGDEAAKGIAVDKSGNTYLTGFTTSTNLPVSKASPQAAFAGQGTSVLTGDAFVAKFDPSGALVYLTYLGGSGDDAATAIAVDSAGSAYITGCTSSSNFPVTQGALRTSYGGSGGNRLFILGDAFVAKLSPAGDKILYATYLGGSRDDSGMAIALDSDGDAYISGFTLSTNFPMVNAFQPGYRGEGGQPDVGGGSNDLTTGDAFVAKLNPSGTQLLFSSYIGGTQDDAALAIAVDAARNIYIAGYTISFDFPTTTGSFQKNYGGQDARNVVLNYGDGFVTKVGSDGKLVYTTYIGGSGDEGVTALAVDSTGAAYLTGSTTSSNFPTGSSPIQKTYSGPTGLPFIVPHLLGDAFAAKLNATGSALLYSTYLGGSQDDMGTGIVVDSTGSAWISGFSNSSDFPVSGDAFQKLLKGRGGQGSGFGVQPLGDGFLVQISPAGDKLLYSTYIGGEKDDSLLALAMDASGNLYAAGSTLSVAFPVTSNAATKSFRGTAGNGYLLGDAVFVVFSTAQTTLGGVGNAASYAAGVVSPGMLAVLGGTGIGPAKLAPGVLDPATNLLATTLAGTRFYFNNVPAPIFYVSNTQSVAVVPYDLQPGTTAQVIAEYQGFRTAAFPVRVVAAAPGLFSADSSGSGGGAIYNQDNSFNSAGNPAIANSIIQMFGTGEGQTDPPGQNGKVAFSVYPKPTLPVLVTIGGKTATVLYAGAIPQQVAGLLQINVVVPAGLAPGPQPVIVTIGTAPSQANLTVAVK